MNSVRALCASGVAVRPLVGKGSGCFGVFCPSPGQGSGGTGAHAGGGEPRLHPLQAAMAFLHLLSGPLGSSGAEGERIVGTGALAGPAAHTGRIVVAHQPGLVVPIEAVYRTGGDTGGVGAMQTGQGEIAPPRLRCV